MKLKQSRKNKNKRTNKKKLRNIYHTIKTKNINCLKNQNTKCKQTRFINIPYTPEGRLNIDRPIP